MAGAQRQFLFGASTSFPVYRTRGLFWFICGIDCHGQLRAHLNSHWSLSVPNILHDDLGFKASSDIHLLPGFLYLYCIEMYLDSINSSQLTYVFACGTGDTVG